MRSFTIEERVVGGDAPPLVIAEVGINHGGDLAVAKHMVDLARSVGAEVIKHQTHIVADEMAPSAKHIVPENASVSIYDLMQACALDEDDEHELMTYVQGLGMIFLSTPFSRAAVDRLRDFDVPAFKVGSGECNNLPLLDYIASCGKPVILSTGMNGLVDIRVAVDILRGRDVDFALMHCTNIYPTPIDRVRLGGVRELIDAFPDAVVGLSDHTTSNLACLGAVALGADLLERHFTDSMDREGPDICCSMDPEALGALVRDSADMKRARGGGVEPVAEERPIAAFAFATVVAVRHIAAGEELSADNLWARRPGDGEIPASELSSLFGKRATADIPSGRQLRRADVG
jgi:N-acetylneuraminate synthase